VPGTSALTRDGGDSRFKKNGINPKLNRADRPAVWLGETASPPVLKETLMRTPVLLLGAALLAGVAGCGAAGHGETHAAPAASAAAADRSTVRVEVAQSSLGPILTDQNGRTLYAFTNDKGGTSSCTGQCIATWPALVSRQAVGTGAGADKALLSQTTRAEGTVQATYGNWPLYYYVGDVGPGDVDGQGVDGVWFVVGADGKLIRTSPAA
jgi:predicted lipoprotein with Yx(FWY)xxD motif